MQMVKFELSSDYRFSLSEKWEVPKDWPEHLADDLRKDRTAVLKEEVDRLAQAEFDDLLKQKEEMSG